MISLARKLAANLNCSSISRTLPGAKRMLRMSMRGSFYPSLRLLASSFGGPSQGAAATIYWHSRYLCAAVLALTSTPLPLERGEGQGEGLKLAVEWRGNHPHPPPLPREGEAAT